MPNIRQYTNEAEVSGAPFEGAAYSMEKLGRVEQGAIDQGVSGVKRGLEAVEEHNQRQEISQLSANLATTHANLTAQWNKIASQTDPNDIEKAAADFREKVAQPAISALGDNLSTSGAQDMFTKASAALTDDIFTKTSADTAHLQGIGAISNAVTVKNQLGNALHSDPSSFETVMQLGDTVVDGLQKSGTLPLGEATKLRDEYHSSFAAAAALGKIEANPTQAKADISSGMYDKYLSQEQTTALMRHADEMEKAQDVQARAQEADLKRKQKDYSDQQANTIMASMIQPDGSLRVTPDMPKAAVNYSLLPGTAPGEARSMIDMIAKVSKEQEAGIKATTDPHTYEDFSTRMLLPSSDPRALSMRQLYQARTEGQLSDKDFSFFRGGIETLQRDPVKKEADRQFNAFLQSQKPAFTTTGLLGVKDPAGYQRFYQFSQAARQQYEQAYQSGDWKGMLDAKNPNFLGKLAKPFIAGKGAQVSTGPSVGEVDSGYKFTGGDPHDQHNWVKVQ